MIWYNKGVSARQVIALSNRKRGKSEHHPTLHIGIYEWRDKIIAANGRPQQCARCEQKRQSRKAEVSARISFAEMQK